MENRYLKPKEAICSVCGDKIKVGEKYALGTIRGYKKDPETNKTTYVGKEEEIFCGFCKPMKLEYIMESENYCKYVQVPDIIRHGKQLYRMEPLHCCLKKYLEFYRNEKEDEE